LASIFDEDPDEPKVALKRDKKREPLTAFEVTKGRRRLYDMVEQAFDTLLEAAQRADYGNAVKAAIAILDRAGFGPKSTVDVNTTHFDLSNLTTEQLAERAKQVHDMILAQRSKQLPVIDMKAIGGVQ
jgi:hypothetical protein